MQTVPASDFGRYYSSFAAIALRFMFRLHKPINDCTARVLPTIYFLLLYSLMTRSCSRSSSPQPQHSPRTTRKEKKRNTHTHTPYFICQFLSTTDKRWLPDAMHKYYCTDPPTTTIHCNDCFNLFCIWIQRKREWKKEKWFDATDHHFDGVGVNKYNITVLKWNARQRFHYYIMK